MLSRRTLGKIVGALLSLAAATAWCTGLAGDQVLGNLGVPGNPQFGNWFTIDATGNPVSTLPTSATVGPGIEFRYSPFAPDSTLQWSVTADLSDNQIRIDERYYDSHPGSTWVVQLSSFTLTLSDLDWNGGAGIVPVKLVTQDPQIALAGFDAHSVKFNIGDVVLYPSGPYAYLHTTVLEVAPVPEPSVIALLLLATVAAFQRKNRRTE